MTIKTVAALIGGSIRQVRAWPSLQCKIRHLLFIRASDRLTTRFDVVDLEVITKHSSN